MADIPCPPSSVRAERRRCPRINGLAPSLADITRQGCALPATAQRFVDRDQAGRGIGARLRQPVLGLELGAFGIQHFEEVDDAPPS